MHSDMLDPGAAVMATLQTPGAECAPKVWRDLLQKSSQERETLPQSLHPKPEQFKPEVRSAAVIGPGFDVP